MGGSVADPMCWVGCGAYVLVLSENQATSRGSISQAGTCQILSLAENRKWSRVWQQYVLLPSSVQVGSQTSVAVELRLALSLQSDPATHPPGQV